MTELTAARTEIGRLADAKAGVDELLRVANDKAKEINSIRDTETREKATLEVRLEQQREQTLAAEQKARDRNQRVAALEHEIEEMRGRPVVAVDDPLYIKALRRLVSTSTNEDEISEAFEMAKQIARHEEGIA